MHRLKTLAIVALLVLAGCPGLTVRPSCTRNIDGSIECSVEIHRDGNHDKPVK
jgi:hypothetical protein